jgi:ribosomal protein S18 acetylase RimI-like enzyme
MNHLILFLHDIGVVACICVSVFLFFFYTELKRASIYFFVYKKNFSPMTFFYDQSISIDHNSNFSFNDVESVLGPLFLSYYGNEQLRSLISSVDHIWCVFDKKINQYIACALVQSHPEDNVLYIKLFGVDKSSQGQGIGTRLLKAIKTWGERKKYFAVILHTQINNLKAIGLYEKVGFRKEYYLKNFFNSQVQYNEPDAYQMILYL